MRKLSIAAMSLAAAGALSLAACSEKTQDNAAATASSAANDVGNAADKVGDVAKDSADAVGAAASDAVDKADAAADKAAVAADKMGNHVKEGAAEAEATMQNEPVSKSKKD
ncbi:hypothetical protein [Novosphingobium olei]|uniref:Uncharacterized protein n=1 Tax=Novosphingobium olei TaxID=2728851 RepID=A0A7Y0BM11_9SPHN|nr:hypothetical protein [Novosphingobium olei]NML92789.1 hypothetical protein [Novosphingobium olei]BEV01352.1 entericidin EcnAB [Novosphingobium olei]